MSMTVRGYPAKMANTREVTPGRSRPVSVMSKVVRGVVTAAGYPKEP